MKNLLKAGLALSALLIAQSGPSLAADSSQLQKLGPALGFVAKKAERNAVTPQTKNAEAIDKSSFGRGGPNNEIEVARVSSDGYVSLDAVASGNANDLAVTLESLGAKNVSVYGRTVSAKVPAERLSGLAESSYLAFARPILVESHVGLIESQGDVSMRTNLTRSANGLDGEGMTIGVLSDSYACNPGSLNDAGAYTTPEEDIENGDINGEVTILSDFLNQSECVDEGRGMAQLIQDVLPKAKIAFHSAFNGEADFAEGIIELAQAGADVIVDDIIYLAEPMFQEGIIAQAADQVAAWGIPYFSSIGNQAYDSYESEYRPVKRRNNRNGGFWHDFDASRAVDPLASVKTGPLAASGDPSQTRIVVQWDEPNFSVSGGDGAQTDVTLVMFDGDGAPVPDCLLDDNGYFIELPVDGLCTVLLIDGSLGGDAVEIQALVDFVGNADIQIGLLTQSATSPGFVKLNWFGAPLISNEYAFDGATGYGHSNALGAEAVGASAIMLTEEYGGDPSIYDIRGSAGEPACVPACLNDFSSAGGVPIFFDVDGNRLSEPEIRLKPGVTGPDGANTSFFHTDTFRDDDDGDGVFDSDEVGEFPNFFGTSASAPHVAALVGQLINYEGSHIRTTKSKKEKEAFQICKLAKGSDLRSDGTTHVWLKERALKRLEKGNILLRPCEATEPADLYQVIRDTAQDMSIRADRTTGETLGTFSNVSEDSSFDFDSGFGFVDAEAALEKFMNPDEQSD